jgi:hypothetical protein
MHQINKRLILSLSVLMIVCGVSLSSGSAFAHNGMDDSTSGNVSSGSGSGSDDSDIATSNSVPPAESETEIENHAHDLMMQFRQEGREKARTEAKSHMEDGNNEKSTEKRHKSCEARKTALTKRMNRMVTQAQKHKVVFDGIYAKVKAFHDNKKLTTANYDSLVAAVDTAEADAAAKIAALKGLDVTVDCSQTNIADSVSSFRAAVKATRDSLKDYRMAIVNLIIAVHGSADDNNKTDSSTNNDSTN